MKIKKRPQGPGPGYPNAPEYPNADLVALESQITLQKRMIAATADHRDHQLESVRAQAQLFRRLADRVVLDDAFTNAESVGLANAYTELAVAQEIAGLAEKTKTDVELTAAQMQVDGMTAMLKAARVERGIV